MIITNLIVASVFTFYTIYVTKLFKSDERTKIQEKNVKLNEYRKIPIKTVEQQKEFLNEKNKKEKWVWNKKTIITLIINIVLTLVLMRAYYVTFEWQNIVFTIWQTVLIMILLPIFVNLILERWNLNKSDLTVFFRGSKNGNNRQPKEGPKIIK